MEDNGKKFGLYVIYASTNYIKRRSLWQTLTNILQNSNLPWSCIGDFNTILGSHEYRGAYVFSRFSMEYFSTWTDNNSLLHLPTKRSNFTWSNGRRGIHLTEKSLKLCIFFPLFGVE